jgi:PIN domain nuclease of toxin-antitoxin system
MKAILDTHTFLWWNTDDPQLSDTAKEIIADGRNELYFSAASAWEIAVKAGRNRLILPEPPERYVANRIRLHRFLPLPIHLSHALYVFNLPDHHRDPFDRLLVAQGKLEEMPILTADLNIAQYDVKTIW